MGEATNIYPNLNDQQQFRSNIINDVTGHNFAEFRERELMSKGLSKYIASFDYFDIIILYIIFEIFNCFVCNNKKHFYCYICYVIGAHLGIASASFSFTFSLAAGIVKKLLKTTQNNKKKYNKIVMLARGILNSIETKYLKH